MNARSKIHLYQEFTSTGVVVPNQYKFEIFYLFVLNGNLHRKMSKQSKSVDIQSELVRPAICQTIENDMKLKNYKVRMESASQSGTNNFVGIIYRVHYEKPEEKEVNSVSSSRSLILKVAPENQSRRAQFCSRSCFLREIFIYDEVIASTVNKQITVNSF